MYKTPPAMEWWIYLGLLSLCQLTHSKPLMILFLDGFRWDYVDIYSDGLVGFPRLLKSGVRAQHVVMDFPTLSLPNQYTLMTGLYNEYHGIVSDEMYDPIKKTEFSPKIRSPEAFWWDKAEPLWIAAEKQNKTSYIYHWPYCNIEIHGISATFCEPYDGIPLMKEISARAAEGLSLLGNSTADLVGIYVKVSDQRAHMYGPRSPQVGRAIRAIDNQINKILNLMEKRSLTENVTLMILSSHGMTDVSSERILRVEDFIDIADVELFMGGGGFLSVWPKPGKLDTVYNRLRGGSRNMAVYKREDTPDTWHFHEHPRIPPVVVSPDKGWTILRPNTDYKKYGRRKDIPQMGNHGYDNNLPDMRGVFMVTGPDFKSSYVSDPIEAVDIYQVICKVLEIKPAPHNGTWDSVKKMLTSSGDSAATKIMFIHWIIYVVLAASYA